MDLDWFPFFLRDFDEGTKEMTNEEVGAYLRLLYYHFHEGSIPAERERAARITGERFSDDTWATLQRKFLPHDSVPADRLLNLRMRDTRLEAEERFRRRQDANRANGRKGGLSRGRRLRSLGELQAREAAESEPIASESLANRQPVASQSVANGKRNSSKEEREDKKTTDLRGDPPVSGPKNSSARRSRRAPPDLKIEEETGAWIKAQFPTVHVDTLRAWTKQQLEKIRNHEFSSPRSDWQAVIRNWVLGCLERGQVPSGAPKDGGDEEKAWQNTLRTAALFPGLSKHADESREDFTLRVNRANQRRLDALEQRTKA
jgi:uncharacterized protein YdaU (DUF1376 family)